MAHQVKRQPPWKERSQLLKVRLLTSLYSSPRVHTLAQTIQDIKEEFM